MAKFGHRPDGRSEKELGILGFAGLPVVNAWVKADKLI